jgi:hypothetical protein
VGDHSVDVYLTTEGSATVSQLTFFLDLSPVLPEMASLTEPGQQVASFSSLGGSLLEAVATLMLVNVETASNSETRDVGGFVPESAVLGSSVSAIGFVMDDHEVVDQEQVHALAGQESGEEAGQQNAASVRAFVLGVDELPFERRLLNKNAGAAADQTADWFRLFPELSRPMTPPAEVAPRPEVIDEIFRQWNEQTPATEPERTPLLPADLEAATSSAVPPLVVEEQDQDTPLPWLQSLALMTLVPLSGAWVGQQQRRRRVDLRKRRLGNEA